MSLTGKLKSSAIALASGAILSLVTVLLEGLTFGFDLLKPVHVIMPFLIGTFFGLVISRFMQASMRVIKEEAETKFEIVSRDLKNVEARFDQFAESTREWFWETDENHRLVFFSSRFYSSMGVPAERVIGKTREEIRRHELDEVEQLEWDRYFDCINKREPFEDFQFRVFRPNGERLVISTSGKPFFNEAGHFCGYRGSGYNVTEDVDQVNRLRHTHELIYQATAILNDGFVLYDADKRLVLCNQRFRDIYHRIADKLEPGTTYGEFVQASADFLMTFQNEIEKQQWVSNKLDYGSNSGIPSDEKLKTGEWLRIIDQSLPDGGMVGLRIDITELKYRDEELENAQRIAQLGSWRWNVIDNSLISCSEIYAVIHGVSMSDVGDLLSRQFEDVIHPQDCERVAECFEQFDKDHLSYEIEYRIIRPDGVVRHVIERGEPSQIIANDVVEQMGTLQDITERKLAEQETIKNEQVLKGAIENIPGGFILIDPDGKIDRFNQKFYELYPSQQSSIKVKQSFSDFLQLGLKNSVYANVPEDPAAWLEFRTLPDDEIHNEFYEQLSDGRWIRIARRKLEDGSQVSIHLDITELQQARRDAEEANQAKTVFSGFDEPRTQNTNARHFKLYGTRIKPDG